MELCNYPKLIHGLENGLAEKQPELCATKDPQTSVFAQDAASEEAEVLRSTSAGATR